MNMLGTEFFLAPFFWQDKEGGNQGPMSPPQTQSNGEITFDSLKEIKTTK